jgi:hypothetical protein
VVAQPLSRRCPAVGSGTVGALTTWCGALSAGCLDCTHVVTMPHRRTRRKQRLGRELATA